MQLIKTLETEEEITSNPEEMSVENFKTQTVGKVKDWIEYQRTVGQPQNLKSCNICIVGNPERKETGKNRMKIRNNNNSNFLWNDLKLQTTDEEIL